MNDVPLSKERQDYRMALMCGETMFMIEELRFLKTPPEKRKEYLKDKWRRFLAIMEVALRLPIYYSRFFPEAIFLSWFFGFPSFGRQQDMKRFKRIPAGADLKVLAAYQQRGLFDAPEKANPKHDNRDYEGDDDFRKLCNEIHDAVLKTTR